MQQARGVCGCGDRCPNGPKRSQANPCYGDANDRTVCHVGQAFLPDVSLITTKCTETHGRENRSRARRPVDLHQRKSPAQERAVALSINGLKMLARNLIFVSAGKRSNPFPSEPTVSQSWSPRHRRRGLCPTSRRHDTASLRRRDSAAAAMTSSDRNHARKCMVRTGRMPTISGISPIRA